eukprot:6718097-Alexandrium_andersonii.AAC.1
MRRRQSVREARQVGILTCLGALGPRRAQAAGLRLGSGGGLRGPRSAPAEPSRCAFIVAERAGRMPPKRRSGAPRRPW